MSSIAPAFAPIPQEELQEYRNGLDAYNLVPTKTSGDQAQCAIHALADAIAGNESPDCAFERKEQAAQIYSELKSFIDNKKEYSSFARYYLHEVLGKLKADVKLLMDHHVSAKNNQTSWYSAVDLMLLLGYYEQIHDAESQFKFVIFACSKQPELEEKIKYDYVTTMKEGETFLPIRNVDQSHWEGFVPDCDPEDVSVTGDVLNVTGFIKTVDPRFNGGVFPVPHRHGKDEACSGKMLQNAYDIGGKACMTKSLAEIMNAPQSKKPSGNTQTGNTGSSKSPSGNTQTGNTGSSKPPSGNGSTSNAKDNKSSNKMQKTKSGKKKFAYKKPKKSSASDHSKSDGSSSASDINSDTDSSESGSDSNSDTDDEPEKQIPSDPREVSADVGGISGGKSGADGSEPKETALKVIRTHDGLLLRTFSGAPKFPTYSSMKALVKKDMKKAGDPKLVELQPRIKKSAATNSISQDFMHFSYLVQQHQGQDLYVPFRSNPTEVTNLPAGEPELKTTLTKSAIAPGIRVSWTFKRNFAYKEKGREIKHDGYVEWSFGKVYDHKNGVDANGIKPGSLSTRIDRTDPNIPLMHIKFTPMVASGCKVTAPQEFLEKGPLSDKEQVMEKTALDWISGKYKKEIHLVLLPMSDEIAVRDAQRKADPSAPVRWVLEEMKASLDQIAKESRVIKRRGFSAYCQRSGRPQVQASQMLPRKHIINQGAPLIKMRAVSRFVDPYHGEVALGYGTELDFEEERTRCEALSRQECAAYLISAGENVIVHIELPSELKFSDEAGDTIKPPPNSRVKLSVVSKKHSKPIKTKGLLIEEEFETRVEGAKSDLVVLVSGNNAGALSGLAKSFEKVSNLQSQRKSVDRYAVRVAIDPNDTVYRYKMDAVHKTYDAQDIHGSRGAWLPMLMYDGNHDKKVFPYVDPFIASDTDPAIGRQAYKDLSKAQDWDSSQKQSIHVAKRLQFKSDITTGAGGSGKTYLIVEQTKGAVASKGLVVLTSERKTVVANLALNYDTHRAPGSKPPVIILASTSSRKSVAEQIASTDLSQDNEASSNDLPPVEPTADAPEKTATESEEPESGTLQETNASTNVTAGADASPQGKAGKVNLENIDDPDVAAEINASRDHMLHIISRIHAGRLAFREGVEQLTVSGHVIRHLKTGTQHFVERIVEELEDLNPGEDGQVKVQTVKSSMVKYDCFAKLRGFCNKLLEHDLNAKDASGNAFWTDEEKRDFRIAQEDAEKYVVASADVIAVTASNAGGDLARKYFASDYACTTPEQCLAQKQRKVFIKMDEAQTVSEPTALILIGKTYSDGSWGSRIVSFSMFADEKQIGVINLSHDYTIGHNGTDRGKCYNEFLAQITMSLATRLIQAGFPVTRLEYQSRMPDALFEPLNDEFYDGRIKTREPRDGFPQPANMDAWNAFMQSFAEQPGADHQTEFGKHALHLRIERNDIKERHCIRTESGGRANVISCMTIWHVLNRLRDVFGDTMSDNVAIQTPYAEQANQHRRLANKKLREGWTDGEIPEIFVTDSAVGREKLVIICDYVVDAHRGLGFTKNKTRMCVFFTRARFAQIVVGANIIPMDDAKKDVEDEDPDTVAFNYKDMGPELKLLGFLKGVSRKTADSEKPVSGLVQDGKFSLVKILNYFAQNFATEDIKRPVFNHLDLHSRLLTYRQKMALESYINYLILCHDKDEDAQLQSLTTEERNGFPAYLEAFNSMIEDQIAALGANQAEDFVPAVPGYETGKEKRLGDYGVRKLGRHFDWAAENREAWQCEQRSAPATPVLLAEELSDMGDPIKARSTSVPTSLFMVTRRPSCDVLEKFELEDLHPHVDDEQFVEAGFEADSGPFVNAWDDEAAGEGAGWVADDDNADGGAGDESLDW